MPDMAYLLANTGAAGYPMLTSYCAPNTKPYDTLVSTKACPNLFANMKQETVETLCMFMARLKDKAKNCGCDAFYDHMVKDRFLYGIRNQ